jgi:hypothetical protein
MSLSLQTHAAAKNPLDVLEQIATANEWLFDRRSDAEMAAEAPGKWCDYGLFFAWSAEISAMHFTCTLDLKVPAPRRTALYQLLALANEKLWIGHFGMDSDDGASAESLEDMVDIAITECERFYPAFQFVLWGGKSPAEALTAAMLECAGEA